MRRRVLITGIGTVCAAGIGNAALVEALRHGSRCFSELSGPRFAGLRATHAALVREALTAPSDSEAKYRDPIVQFVLQAAKEALANAGLGEQPLGSRAGVVLGTCSGGMLSIEHHYKKLAAGDQDLSEDEFYAKLYWTTGRILSCAIGATGPCLTVVTACAAGSGSLAHAADLVRSGLVEVAVAGGADTFALSTLAGFDALKATCTGLCAPFSENIGLNLGEGAAILVLESEAHAVARGAQPLAELLGYGMSNDAFHPTSPDPTTRGQVSAMERALKDAGLPAAAIDYVNAHGTGTRANDPTESKAINRLLGERAAHAPTSSTKSIIGHCLGGAGALEAAAVILSAGSGITPPTAGFTGPREGCTLDDYVPDIGRPFPGRIALSNSFGFAGHNACLVLDTQPSSSPVGQTTTASAPGAGHAVVTGLSVISSLGLGAASLAGETMGIRPVERFTCPVPGMLAGLVEPIDARKVDRRLDLRDMDLCSQYATVAARLALEDSGFKTRAAQLAEVGLLLGLATGPSQAEGQHLRAVLEHGAILRSLGAFPYVVPNAVAGCVARALEIKGHHSVVTAGEGSGLVSLILASQAIEQGHSESLLAVSADELSDRTITDSCLVGLWGPSTEVLPGEGAAALFLESESSALSRNARILARILGYGLTVSAHDERRASADALTRALRQALERAEVSPSGIHGLASAARGSEVDDLEREALRDVFGQNMVPAITISDRTGFAEASMPLFNLAYLLRESFAGALLAACFLSSDGVASAAILRVE